MSHNRKIIGLCGYYGSGKDEAAKALIAQGWHRIAFADPVRAMALAIDPMVDSYEDDTLGLDRRLSRVVADRGWLEAKRIPEVRRLLQRIGTDAVREVIGQDTWVQIAERSMPTDRNIVFTDSRFANEIAMIRSHRGLIIRIDRPGNEPAVKHVSETYPFTPDLTIINDGTIEELHQEIVQLAENLPYGDLIT